ARLGRGAARAVAPGGPAVLPPRGQAQLARGALPRRRPLRARALERQARLHRHAGAALLAPAPGGSEAPAPRLTPPGRAAVIYSRDAAPRAADRAAPPPHGAVSRTARDRVRDRGAARARRTLLP